MDQEICFTPIVWKVAVGCIPDDATFRRTRSSLPHCWRTGTAFRHWPLAVRLTSDSFFPRKPKISRIYSRPWRMSAETMPLSDTGLDLDYGILGLATVWSGTCQPTFRETYCLHLHGTASARACICMGLHLHGTASAWAVVLFRYRNILVI